MRITRTPLAGVFIVEPTVHEDERGYFMESYQEQWFKDVTPHVRFIQDNESMSQAKGTLRGIHYQSAPYEQTKLVRVISGAIYDVAVDLRRQSATFGQYYGIELNAVNKKQLYIGKGFGHAFLTLSSNTQVCYKVDEMYVPSAERGIKWDDMTLNIPWPTEVKIVSDKDRSLPTLNQVIINE